MTKPRVYTPEDTPRIGKAFVDGREVFDGIRACPGEGWIDVLEHEDGDNFTTATGPYLKKGRGKRDLATKRIRGVIRLVDELGHEYS